MLVIYPVFFKILFCLQVIWEKWLYEEETCSKSFIFIVFKNINRVKISKIINLPCYIFILLLFSEREGLYLCFWCSVVKHISKLSSTKQIWGFCSTSDPFSSFTTRYFFILFLFLTQVIISFPYLALIKCNFLSIKDDSFVQSFAVLKLL